MIRIENVDVFGWESAIRGMRNPMNSWKKSDSGYRCTANEGDDCLNNDFINCDDCISHFKIGPNDRELMMTLRNAGPDHRKFMRMIIVYVDITAPLYFWKEFDTYKVGTVANSCSTMHKLGVEPFTLNNFSCEDLYAPEEDLLPTINKLNIYRENFKNSCDISDWRQMIQLLPSSYNQKRTVMLNYEVLANMYKSRCNHKLDEWRDFCVWIESLPYSELITGEEQK